MDILKSKATVTSGLFGLITAKLEDAHDASVIGQGNLNDVGRQTAINCPSSEHLALMSA